MNQRLKWARERAGFEHAKDAAIALGIPVPTYIGHENGQRGFKRDAADLYARRFKVGLEWLLTGRGAPDKGTIQVKAAGYVGAGAAVHPIDDHSPGDGLEDVDLPAGVPMDAVLVIVRGDSMYPRYFDGERLFYLRDQRPPGELLNRECVVRTADGRMYVKILRRGADDGLFNLESWNPSTPTMIDQVIEWAAPVVARVNTSR